MSNTTITPEERRMFAEDSKYVLDRSKDIEFKAAAEAILRLLTALEAAEARAEKAGAALALQRLMDAAQAMREAQTAFERLVQADDHESIPAILRRAANTMGDAEDTFDDLLAGYRRDMNFVK